MRSARDEGVENREARGRSGSPETDGRMTADSPSWSRRARALPQPSFQWNRPRSADFTDLSIGDPDLAPPDFLLRMAAEEVASRVQHRYPGPHGLELFRTEVAEWFRTRFGVRLDPSREVSLIIGTKEGIAHLCLALLDPDTAALVPDPGYPAYRAACVLAGAEAVPISLDGAGSYLPDLTALPPGTLHRTRLLFVNYPHNPTGAIATVEDLRDIVEFAAANGIVVCNDAAYSEIRFDHAPQTSLLQPFGTESPVVEFYSCSKTFAVPGWRIGFAVGHAKVIEALRRVKSAVDLGQFCGFQAAVARALGDPRTDPYLDRTRAVYQRRRDVMINEIKRFGVDIDIPRGTFYLWLRTRQGTTGEELTEKVLGRGLLLSPGRAFGQSGHSFVRLSLTVPEERLLSAARVLCAEMTGGEG
jgi:LL-diaminopimelate aminotransferase